MDDHLAANRANWDDRVPIHVASDLYGSMRGYETALGCAGGRPKHWATYRA